MDFKDFHSLFSQKAYNNFIWSIKVGIKFCSACFIRKILEIVKICYKLLYVIQVVKKIFDK